MRLGVAALVGLGACAPRAPLRAVDCASCHAEVAAEFAGSRHRVAGQGVVYLAMLDTVPAAQRAFCEGCHVRGRDGERGLDCLTCHEAVGNEVTQNGLLRDGPAGLLGSASEHPPQPAAHAVVSRPFMRSAELCGTCHEVHGVGAFTETPFTEWQTSASAAEGETCQACHMRRDGKVSHRFEGVHGDGPALLAGMVQLNGALQGQRATVSVTSQLRGHSFPSGARFARDAWLEVTAIDAVGTETTVNGALSGGRLELGDLALAHGQRTFFPWLADELQVRALSAGGSAVFQVPVAAGTLHARARLLFRPYHEDLLAALPAVRVVENPVTELAAVNF